MPTLHNPLSFHESLSNLDEDGQMAERIADVLATLEPCGLKRLAHEERDSMATDRTPLPHTVWM